MGICQNCGKKINLKPEDKVCPLCGENPYSCWNCQTEVDITKAQCSLCGYFECPSCQMCGPDCRIEELVKEVKQGSIKEMIRQIYSLFQGSDRRQCLNRVPISYAEHKLRNLVLKMQGFKVKGDKDMAAFGEKYNQLIDKKPLGATWTINQVREVGTHGQELREASYLGVCLGQVAVTQMVKKVKSKGQIKAIHYDVFSRVDKKPCQFLNYDLQILRCPKCKTIYDKKYAKAGNFCTSPSCKPFAKGRNKGQRARLKLIASKEQLCTLPRLNFRKLKKEGGKNKQSTQISSSTHREAQGEGGIRESNSGTTQ